MTALDDTSRCPTGVRCESCGVEEGIVVAVGQLAHLEVVTADLAGLGVACLTMCARCGESEVAPPVSVATAARLVLQHAMHLGVTVDDAHLDARLAARDRLRAAMVDPTRSPGPGYVPILCTDHGEFVAWCSPPAPPCRVACPPSCGAPAERRPALHRLS